VPTVATLACCSRRHKEQRERRPARRQYGGQEVRFGISGSALFADITTAFTTGAVNSAHDSYTPLPGISMLGK